jgi:FkbM family methyltransferase
VTPGTACKDALLRFPGGGIPEQKMCLRANDFLTRRIRRTGRWFDCDRLLVRWRQAPEASGSVFLDIGANVGACTLMMLLATNASVIAVEPSPSNLFYLTRSLRLAVQRDPSLASRVSVLPVGAGDSDRQAPLFAAHSNAGNSVIGRFTSLDNESSHFISRVDVRRMDPVLALDHRRPVGLMKIDAQGFECNVLRGMRTALASGAVRAITMEVSEVFLANHECSELALKDLLQQSGYAVQVTTVDLTASRAESTLFAVHASAGSSEDLAWWAKGGFRGKLWGDRAFSPNMRAPRGEPRDRV